MKRILFYGYFLGYIIAIAGPIFLDSKLSLHVCYGPGFYLLVPLVFLSLAVLIAAEYVVLRYAKRAVDLYWSLVPYAIAFALSLPIFLPEMPHGNLTFVYLIVLTLSAAAISLRANMDRLLLDSTALRRDDPDQREYLREALSFSKQLTFALLAAYATVIITWYSRTLGFIKGTVFAPGEIFLLSVNVVHCDIVF